EDRGVTIAEAESAALNLYSSRYRASAALVDSAGEEVHRWEAPPEDEHPSPWMHVEPLEGGDLLVITKGVSVSRLTWSSEIVWRADVPAHHDLAVHPDDGRVLALVRRSDHLDYDGASLPILADGVAILSPDGEVLDRVELVPVLRPLLSSSRLRRIRDRLETSGPAGIARGGGLGDVLHVNSIEVLPRDIDGVAPRGSFLMSFRAIDRVLILDADLQEVLWTSPSGLTQGQHDATILDDDRFLIFDNGSRRGRSRVIELDPRTNEVGWSFAPEEGLFTQLRGGAQRLSSGNTLITESDTGRALEVTRDGELVWEFWNPHVHGAGEAATREVIYRLNRFPRAFFGEHP
ncbi:MAG: arylsulfotransferase family protein, partial [Sandaracinaceae bacterium]